jgi:hypothetical protein
VTFKARLAAIKRMRGFVSWGESSAFAYELASLLAELEASISDPRTGAELVAAFYEMDDVIFNHCDDSNGRIGDVFRHDARNLFVHYASRCADKQWLGDLILRLNRNDGFGLRDSLFDCAADYLPEETMRGLIGSLWALADREANEYQKRHWLRGIESFARQLRDAPLFEQAQLAAWPTLCTAARVDIAEVYLKSGDAPTALSWLERIPASETFQADKRDRLLLAIHEQLGNRGKQEEAAWRIFRRYRCEDTLSTLLRVIGDDQRERVIDEEARGMLQSEGLSYSDTTFLISGGRMDDAEAYLLARAGQLDGYFYDCLLPLAEDMERDRRFRMASVIYRALLESILSRAQSKYYHHGVRYLKKLEALAGKVDTWLTVQPHQTYMDELRQAHRRKSSFWSRYNA